MSEPVLDVAVHVPVMLVRFSLAFLRYEMRRKRGVRTFKKELRAQNIGREHVNLLTKSYQSAGSVRSLINNIGKGGSILDLARLG